MKTNRTFGIILFVTGLFLSLVPRYILPVCEYQGHPQMSCSHTGFAEMLIGVIVMAAAVGLVLTKTADALRCTGLTSLAAGVSVILAPQIIGYCHNSTMPCNYGTVPVLRLIGGLIIVLSLSGFLISLKKEK